MKKEHLESYLWDGFRDRLNRRAIKTTRYLWHVTDNNPEVNLSIASEGLICDKDYAVFAHNNVQDFNALFPYIFTSKLSWMGCEEHDKFNALLRFSFWRIDTSLVDGEWYVDPNMERDLHRVRGLKVTSSNFVCTLVNVPPAALKLFQIDFERFFCKKPTVAVRAGVTSVYMPRRDFDCLRLDRDVDRFLNWKKERFYQRLSKCQRG